jgi:uncharacterized membrane protein
MNPDVIRACTPLFLAGIGGAIGLGVLFGNVQDAGKWSAGIGLAGTAIAGAAGLAQNTKHESNITAEGNARIVQDNPTQPSGTP